MSFDKMNLVEVKLEEKAKLKGLMSLYLHDLSEFAEDLKVNKDGLFEYEGIDLYFKDEELMPFFICTKNEVVGFVLINSGKFVDPNIDYSIHELFILKGFRRKGIAQITIEKILNSYMGKYKVEQLKENKTAIGFWRNFYEVQGIKYIEEKEEIDGFECLIQIFNN